MIENTTYNGEGKPVYDYFNPCSNKEPVDWKGRNIVPHEEYYSLEGNYDEVHLVSLDDIVEYLEVEELYDLTLNQLINHLAEVLDVYPEIIIK